MSLYALADFHLSLGTDKPMDVFGGAWNGYMEKLNHGLSCLKEEDTLVIPGDLCWAMELAQAKADFDYVAAIPGRKIILKGNHDYWWTTAAKFCRFCEQQHYENLFVLHNNCYFYGDTALCGTRGWFYEEERGVEHDALILRREVMRLETSLQLAGDREKLVFLHYPPLYKGYCCEPILELLKKYEVRQVYYGHLHSESHRLAMTGWHDGIEYHLIAADYVNFNPVFIRE